MSSNDPFEGVQRRLHLPSNLWLSETAGDTVELQTDGATYHVTVERVSEE
jgi:hypothetical protein